MKLLTSENALISVIKNKLNNNDIIFLKNINETNNKINFVKAIIIDKATTIINEDLVQERVIIDFRLPKNKILDFNLLKPNKSNNFYKIDDIDFILNIKSFYFQDEGLKNNNQSYLITIEFEFSLI